MKTIKEYAKEHNVSYEAIRKQIARYKQELNGHIVKKNRILFLDDEAINFLNSKRRESPVIIQEVAKDERIDQLQNENKQLLLKIADLQQLLLSEQKEKNELANKQLQLELEAKSLKEKAEAYDEARKSFLGRLFIK